MSADWGGISSIEAYSFPGYRTGAFFAHPYRMANDEKGAIENEVEKIDTIVSDDSLGYIGMGREEHSGENSPTPPEKLEDELADNKPEDIK